MSVSEIQFFELSQVSPAGDLEQISSFLSQCLLSNRTTSDLWGNKNGSGMQIKRNWLYVPLLSCIWGKCGA